VRLRTGRGRERGEQAAAPATASPHPAPSPAPPSPGHTDDLDRQALLHPSLTRVVVAIRDLALHQEVLDFVARDGRVDVAGAATDVVQLERAMRQGTIDAVICCGHLAAQIDDPGRLASGDGDHAPQVHLVSPELTVADLRRAIQLGAAGAFRWPEERNALGRQLHRRRASAPRPGARRGLIVAVHGARGGAGTTFIACQLAVALSARGLSTVLMDAALAFSDVTAALGVPADQPVRTISDLLPVVDEISTEHLAKVLYPHPAGFGVLLGPIVPSTIGAAEGTLARSALSSLRSAHDVVVVHTPRSLDTAAHESLQLADVTLLVTTLDLFSLYGAKRAVQRLAASSPTHLDVVVSNTVRAPVGVGDLARVIGMTPIARVRFDAAVPRAQQRGELLRPRSGRAARDVDRLAETVHARAAAGAGQVG
jgi:Flp pilus assembly CpaE family ATPase